MAKTTFIDGNPNTQTLGTVVDAAFLNLIFNHQHDGTDADGHAPILLDNVKTVNAAYAVAAADMVLLADATTAAFTITLPDATTIGAGRKYFIKKIDAGVNAVTVACTGAQTIDGVATAILRATNDSIIIIGDGTNWRIFKVPLTVDNVKTVTAAYLISGLDMVVLADATTAAFTITLPDASVVGAGRKFVVKKIDSSVNAITLACTGAQTVDGNTSVLARSKNDVFQVISDGSNWQIETSNPLLLAETTLTSAAASVSFTGLGTFKEYTLIGSLNIEGFQGVISLTFNGDPSTSTDYSYSSLQANGSGGFASNASTTTSIVIQSSNVPYFRVMFSIDIMLYNDGTILANCKWTSQDGNQNTYFGVSALYKKTTVNSITSIMLTFNSTLQDNMDPGANFQLYRRK